MGMPGYFYIEIHSKLENETYTRSIKLVGGCGLTWLSAARTFTKDDDYEYSDKLTEEEIEKCNELDRKFFVELTTETAGFLDGIYKIVYDQSENGYKYMLYDEVKHKDF
jgi:hypothetical protein